MLTKKYIEIPNLPTRPVKKVLVDYRISQKSVNKLEQEGIEVLFTTRHDKLYEAVLGHPDMQIYHVCNNTFVCEPGLYDYYKKLFPDALIIPGDSYLNAKYPDDIAYNAARVDNFIFHKLLNIDKKISIYAAKHNLKLINVNQGYSKCSICVVSNNAIITSDFMISKAAKEVGIDALYVDSNDVKLSGVSNGFIGGIFGKISENKLVVNGDIKRLKYGNKIIEFCYKYNVNILNLNEEIPYDIGSIIPVCY